jgi:hypothetical protein
MMLLATSPERAAGELGLTPAFPALASSISRAAGKEREPLSQVIGEAVRLNVPPKTDVMIKDAQGRVTMAPARELVRRPANYFSEPGIYQLEFAGRQKFMAFNAPSQESERALMTSDELERRFPTNEAGVAGAVSAGGPLEARERSGQVWRYFLCAAFLLMVAELFVAMRGRMKATAAAAPAAND